MSNIYSYIQNILQFEIADNTVGQIILALLAYLFVFFLLKKIIYTIIDKIQDYTQNKKKKNLGVILLELIHNTPRYFFIILELYIPAKILTLTSTIDQVINGIFTLVVILQVIRFLNKILIYLLKDLFKKKGKIEKTTQNALQIIVKIVVWVIGGLLLLSNLGIEITPLIASLGIGGIAVAFALQNVLEDLFSSLSIIFSRPFEVGDYITLNDGSISGTIKDISLKSTHITNILGHDIRIPNKTLISSTLSNYGKMKTRRIRFDIGVTYETPSKVLKQIPSIIEKIITKQELVDFERCKLNSLGDFSINFKTSYVINDPDYITYLNINQDILLSIIEQFEKKGIEIAYPTQVIYNKKI